MLHHFKVVVPLLVEKMLFRTFNDGLNFPDTHPGNGCKTDTLKCKLLSSDLDNTFLGSGDQNELFQNSDNFYGDIDGNGNLIYPENQGETGTKVGWDSRIWSIVDGNHPILKWTEN